MHGLALSGGGFRATLFHLGLVSYLYDAERAARISAGGSERGDEVPEMSSESRPSTDYLSGIRFISSVSGGSILAAHLSLNWKRYTDFDNPDNFAAAAGEIIDFVRRDIRGRIVRRLPFNLAPYWLSVVWRRTPYLGNDRMPAFLRRSTSDSLERYYDKYLFKGRMLNGLTSEPGDERPTLFLMTTNLGHEDAYAEFSSVGLQTASLPTPDGETTPVARAVAASSAFPGMFTPIEHFCLDEESQELRLADGGIFDNLGIKKFFDLLDKGENLSHVMVSDASVAFRAKFGFEFLDPVTVPLKAADILMRRVHEMECASAAEAASEYPQCRFTFVQLRHRFASPSDGLRLSSDYRKRLAFVRTDLDMFSDLEIAALIRHGYSVAKDILALPAPAAATTTDSVLPGWNPLARSRDALARGLFDRNSPLAEKIKRGLERSSERKSRLVSARDPISYLTAGILAAVAILVFGAGFDINSKLLASRENTENLALTYLPSNFNGKFGVVLFSSPDLGATRDFAARPEIRKAGNTYILKREATAAPDGSKEAGTVFNCVLVYNSMAAAAGGRETAIRNNTPVVGEPIFFDADCPDAALDAREAIYVCPAKSSAMAPAMPNPAQAPPAGQGAPYLDKAAPTVDALRIPDETGVAGLSVDQLETLGFASIARNDHARAQKYFDAAYDVRQDYHNVSEIRNLLRTRQSVLTGDVGSATTAVAWQDLKNEILARYSWGMPKDVRTAFLTPAE